MSATTPENCPKCGAAVFKGTLKYTCGSWADEFGWLPIEGNDCVTRQRDQLAQRVKGLEEQLAFAQAALESAERREN